MRGGGRQKRRGKSTLLRVAAGLTRPDAGRVAAAKGAVLSYLPERPPALKISARRWIRGLSDAGSRDPDATLRRAEDAMALLSASEFLDAPMGSLSKGTLQKVAVAVALSARPDVLLLDEPLGGQDEPAQRALLEALKDAKAARAHAAGGGRSATPARRLTLPARHLLPQSPSRHLTSALPSAVTMVTNSTNANRTKFARFSVQSPKTRGPRAST